ncbi:transposase [Enterococcus faecalis]|nr:transposase [Enterococcus faecalis]MDN3139658.1 transposase [Enterococcus faecalis]
MRISYFNGSLKCLNNHIKVVERIVYGLRNFQKYLGKYFKKTKNIT